MSLWYTMHDSMFFLFESFRHLFHHKVNIRFLHPPTACTEWLGGGTFNVPLNGPLLLLWPKWFRIKRRVLFCSLWRRIVSSLTLTGALLRGHSYYYLSIYKLIYFWSIFNVNCLSVNKQSTLNDCHMKRARGPHGPGMDDEAAEPTEQTLYPTRSAYR